MYQKVGCRIDIAHTDPRYLCRMDQATTTLTFPFRRLLPTAENRTDYFFQQKSSRFGRKSNRANTLQATLLSPIWEFLNNGVNRERNFSPEAPDSFTCNKTYERHHPKVHNEKEMACELSHILAIHFTNRVADG